MTTKAKARAIKRMVRELGPKKYVGFPGQHRGPNGRGFQLEPNVLADVMEEAMTQATGFTPKEAILKQCDIIAQAVKGNDR
jgi:hypothetical protein